MRLRFTRVAQRQFLDALALIHADNPPAAQRLRVRAENALRRVIRFPLSGRRVPEFPELPYREVVVSPYRFFYRVERDVIWVVAVWHGAQLPANPRGE